MITNACATQAIASVLFNCYHDDLKLGPTLTEFKEFAQVFDPQVCSNGSPLVSTTKEILSLCRCAD